VLALSLAAAGTAQKPAGKDAGGKGEPAAQAKQAAKAAPAANAAPFAVAMPDTTPKDAVRRILLKPYLSVTGAALNDAGWDGATLDGLKGKTADLALVSAAQAQAGCKSQQLARLDWGRLNRDRFLPAAAGDCGAGAYVAASGLAWDRDKLNFVPNWQDFWDIARHPGRRGLQKTARGNLEYALLADGVAAGDVYRTLRSQDGQDRAFRKLDQLKPYLTWWDQPGQPAQMLAAGKVLFTSAPAASVLTASAVSHRHFGLQWAGSLTETTFWAVPQASPQGAPHAGASALALLVATDPARLAEFFQATGLGPPTRDALEMLPEASRGATPAAGLTAGLALDEGFWADNQAKLEQRFAAWLAK
jgi:putative spermidine/putrescine transport system substrate-binding protein